MSFKTGLIKMAIKLTPNMMIIWVANIVLKDIAELTDFNFDLEERKVYIQIQLLGESETIEVWLENFAVVKDEESYKLIVQQAQSNRLWLNNLLSRVAGKAWKIPEIPQLTAQLELVAELFKTENTEAENPEQQIIDGEK
jgi:hypothetical protein